MLTSLANISKLIPNLLGHPVETKAGKNVEKKVSNNLSQKTRYGGDTPGPCFGLTGTYHLDRKDPPSPTK